MMIKMTKFKRVSIKKIKVHIVTFLQAVTQVMSINWRSGGRQRAGMLKEGKRCFLHGYPACATTICCLTRPGLPGGLRGYSQQ